MTPKWQQSEEAATAGRYLSEGRIMSIRGQKHFSPESWQNPGQMQSKKEQKGFPVIPITLGDAINDYKYSKAMQEIRKELRKLDQEIKKDGGVIDWNRMLNDFI